MRKKHSYEDRLKYMKMLEAGCSVNYIHDHYGIGDGLLKSLWIKYQQEGQSALVKKKNIRADGALKETIIRDIEENFIPLHEASVKYDVSVSRLSIWLRIVREGGYTALYEQNKLGHPPKDKDMGRPRKKKPEEMTELERLRYENECLRTENALLKKVRALVEERNARLRESGQKPSKN